MYEKLQKRIDKLKKIIETKSFIEERGLGNEIPFHIFDYQPSAELFLRDKVDFITKKFNQKNPDKEIILINLFHLIIESLKEKNYLEKTFKLEQKKSKDKILKGIKKSLRITKDNSYIKMKIKQKAGKNKIIFLTGVGTAWPLLRGSQILNNLHSVITKNPLIIFYPGSYNQHDLKLFNEIKSEHYYRAFMIEPDK